MKVIKRNPIGRLAAALTTLIVVIGLFILQTSCTNSAEVDTPVPEMAEENVDEQQNAAVAPEGTATPEQLIEAVRAGHLEEVQLLLDAGADVNARMNAKSGTWIYNRAPAITHAVLTNHSEMVELLIANGADLELAELGYLDTALHTAAHLNNADIVKILLENGADPNPISKHTNWETPLHYAAEAGAVEAIHALLDGGVDADVRKGQGRSPMMNFIKEGRPEILTEVVTILLDSGADPNLQDSTGSTALHYAASKAVKHDIATEVVTILLEKGADPNLQDNSGSTALHYAAIKGRTEVIRLLLEHGANLDMQDNIGDTALHHASKSNRAEAVSFLIEQGASLIIKNEEDETAADVASGVEILEMLSEAGN